MMLVSCSTGPGKTMIEFIVFLVWIAILFVYIHAEIKRKRRLK